MANKHTMDELYQWQALPLSIKLKMTQYRIREWINMYGEEGVYVSFSGGKDSTVLLDIVRKMGYKNVPAVFVDVATQYPELKTFAKKFCEENEIKLEILKPMISFMDICKKYGFPIISKEVSESVMQTRVFLKNIENGEFSKQGAWAFCDVFGIDRRSKDGKEIYKRIKNGEIPDEAWQNLPVKIQELFGKVIHKEKGMPTNEYSKRYYKSKYSFFIDAPFEISNYCCKVMKKNPAHKYQRKTGRHAIIATMASESRLRTEHWLKSGCNSFEGKEPISKPISFWTEQDVLLYIQLNNLPICSVYGDVVVDYAAEGNVDGQMNMSELSDEYGEFDLGNRPLKTTGCNRTGCVLCGFGCHLEDEDEARFVRLKQTHPKLYGLLDVIENNGVTYRQAIDWINENGNLNIRY